MSNESIYERDGKRYRVSDDGKVYEEVPPAPSASAPDGELEAAAQQIHHELGCTITIARIAAARALKAAALTHSAPEGAGEWRPHAARLRKQAHDLTVLPEHTLMIEAAAYLDEAANALSTRPAPAADEGEPCRYPNCDGSPATGYCHVRCRPAPAAGEWQTIETAPKDGTSILIGDVRVFGGDPQVVFWDDEGKEPYCWQTSDGPAYHKDKATHWMPLPDPPSALASSPSPGEGRERPIDQITLHRCLLCGCLWRHWASDDFWSLADGKQRPCKECDNGPKFLSVLDPPATRPAPAAGGWQTAIELIRDLRTAVRVEASGGEGELSYDQVHKILFRANKFLKHTPSSPSPGEGRVWPSIEQVIRAARVLDPAAILGLTWEECCERAQAMLLAAGAPELPAIEGWKLTSREPTEAMHKAANREWDGRMSARSCGVWQAMWDAAPSAAAPVEGQAPQEDDGPGTPLGRLASIARFAESIGHSPISAKPAELFLIEAYQRLAGPAPQGMREALIAMRERDDRNGSLPKAYREIIDAALSAPVRDASEETG